MSTIHAVCVSQRTDVAHAGSVELSEAELKSILAPFIIGSKYEVKLTIVMRRCEDVLSNHIANLQAGAKVILLQMGTDPRRVKVWNDAFGEGWVSLCTPCGQCFLAPRRKHAKKSAPKYYLWTSKIYENYAREFRELAAHPNAGDVVPSLVVKVFQDDGVFEDLVQLDFLTEVRLSSGCREGRQAGAASGRRGRGGSQETAESGMRSDHHSRRSFGREQEKNADSGYRSPRALSLPINEGRAKLQPRSWTDAQSADLDVRRKNANDFPHVTPSYSVIKTENMGNLQHKPLLSKAACFLRQLRGGIKASPAEIAIRIET